jgi:hypothetical protein
VSFHFYSYKVESQEATKWRNVRLARRLITLRMSTIKRQTSECPYQACRAQIELNYLVVFAVRRFPKVGTNDSLPGKYTF